MSKRYAAVGELDVAYYEEGEGPPVLFIHGIPTSSYLWRNVMRYMKKQHRCLAPDLMGLGDTRGPLDSDYTMPAQAAMLAGFLKTLGIRRAHVVAHDQGGAAAQILAARYPNRIDRLILLNCVAFDNWPVPEIRRLQRLGRFRRLGELAAHVGLARRFAHSRFGLRRGVYNPNSLSEETIDEYLRPFVTPGESRERARRFLLAGDGRYTMEAVEGLRKFKRPTLIAWATEDPFLSVSWALKLKETIPGTKRLEFLPFTGHFVPEERPAELADLFTEFLAEDWRGGRRRAAGRRRAKRRTPGGAKGQRRTQAGGSRAGGSRTRATKGTKRTRGGKE